MRRRSLPRFPLPRFTLPALTLALSLGPGEARAQSSEAQKAVAAQALYDQAVAAMQRRDYATACPKLEQVVLLAPKGIGAKLTLAECYESEGRIASAFTTYTLVEAAAAAANQVDRQRKAHASAMALKPKLAVLTIEVPEALRALPGLKIQRDGEDVEAVALGLPLPIDRGEHVIRATATGKQPWEKAVKIELDGVQASVQINELVDARSPDAKGPPPPGPRAAPPSPPPPPADKLHDLGSAQRTAGVVVGGLGIATVAVGAFFGVRAIGKARESNAGPCDAQDRCDDAGLALRREGLLAGNVATALFIVGGAAIAGGVVLFATAPRARSAVSGAKITLSVGGIAARGTW